MAAARRPGGAVPADRFAAAVPSRRTARAQRAHGRVPATGQPLGPLPPAAPGPPANDRAVLALVLGIGGLVAFFGARLGLIFVLNLPPSIAAWVVGVQARRRVDRGETDQHRAVAQAGLVMGVVGTVLGVLAIVGWTLALTMSEDARRFLLDIL